MKHYLLALLISSTAAAVVAGEEKYGPMNVDGGHITCKSFSGDEIKSNSASLRQVIGFSKKIQFRSLEYPVGHPRSMVATSSTSNEKM
jgi:hypothetical protein